MYQFGGRHTAVSHIKDLTGGLLFSFLVGFFFFLTFRNSVANATAIRGSEKRKAARKTLNYFNIQFQDWF